MKSKTITNTARVIITLSVWFMFALVWNNDYNSIVFKTHRGLGYIGTVIVWLAIYSWMGALFGAFSIASSYISDVIISQLICIGIPDLFMYFSSCLLARRWTNIWPGVVCVIIQMIIIAWFTTLTKGMLMRKLIPSRTIVIYGRDYTAESAKLFTERLLEKYKHLFEIEEIVEEHIEDLYNKIDDNERVVLAGVDYNKRKEIAKYCIDNNKTFYFIPDIEEIIFQNCTTKNLLDTPLKRYDFVDDDIYYNVTKRILDLVIAIPLFVITLPIMLVTAVAIKLEDGGPVFFKQLRVTKDEKTFDIIKFRSMVVDADKYGVMPTTGKDPRITKVGGFCRATRIDELPQLINIIRGDMAFVGPRPERIEHVQKYEAELPEFKYRHMVKGGLTGYAQVYGKYNTSAEDKLKLDLMYIMNRSIYMDMRLFLLTVRTVLQKESTEGFSEEKAKEMNETAGQM